LFTLIHCMYFIEKLKAVCGFDLPRMESRENLPAKSLKTTKYDENIAFIEDLWNYRYDGMEKRMSAASSDPLRNEYHKLFNCISRSNKMMKKLGKEKGIQWRLVECKENSIPEMEELILMINRRIPPTHPIPYMWNAEQQREVIGNLNMKWEEMVLQDYLSNLLPDDDESDNDVSFDEKYDIAKD
ncbi:hypothetical protein PFISCL1PPCAC_28991, partial [Pristionchus fissidentatus]